MSIIDYNYQDVIDKRTPLLMTVLSRFRINKDDPEPTTAARLKNLLNKQ